MLSQILTRMEIFINNAESVFAHFLVYLKSK